MKSDPVRCWAGRYSVLRGKGVHWEPDYRECGTEQGAVRGSGPSGWVQSKGTAYGRPAVRWPPPFFRDRRSGAVGSSVRG